MAPTSRRFDDADLADVRTRTDLLALVTDHGVETRRSGTTWKGLCPFHDERTPSFTVRPDDGLWHCFGCSEGGDAIAFVQKTQAMGFPEAVRYLADRFGVSLKEEADPAQQAAIEQRRSILAANTALHELMTGALGTAAAAAARDELTSRGFTQHDATEAGCGYAPADGATTLNYLRDHGVSEDTGIAAGFLRRTTDGRVVALFRDRLTWPIRDATGRVVGFGARRLSETDTMGKYVNSAEGPLFHKSELLFGWDTARKAAVAAGRVLVVEGYTDVMAAHAAGVFEVVASCGTAFGETHLRTLTRALPNSVRVVYCFDGDDAGRKAAHKAWEVSLQVANRCAAVTMPPGTDPCGVYQIGGPDALTTILDGEQPLTATVLHNAAAAHPQTPEGASLAAAEVTSLVASIPDQVLRDKYTQWAHHKWGTPAPTSHAPRPPQDRPGGSPAQPLTGWGVLQRRVARRAITDPQHVLSHLGEGEVTEPATKEALGVITRTTDRTTATSGPAWAGAVWDTARDTSPAAVSALTAILAVADPDGTETATIISSWVTQSAAARTARRRDELVAQLSAAPPGEQEQVWEQLVALDEHGL